MDGLWPDEQPEHPTKALQILVSRARAALRAAEQMLDGFEHQRVRWFWALAHARVSELCLQLERARRRGTTCWRRCRWSTGSGQRPM